VAGRSLSPSPAAASLHSPTSQTLGLSDATPPPASSPCPSPPPSNPPRPTPTRHPHPRPTQVIPYPTPTRRLLPSKPPPCRIILNKTDLVPAQELSELTQRLRAINSMATLLPAQRSVVPVDYVLGVGGFDLDKVEAQVGWGRDCGCGCGRSMEGEGEGSRLPVPAIAPPWQPEHSCPRPGTALIDLAPPLLPCCPACPQLPCRPARPHSACCCPDALHKHTAGPLPPAPR
jgi:hypothetical protein